MRKINRRDCMTTLAGSLIGASTAEAAAARTAAPRRPNIIMIETDSWDGRAMGALGRPGMSRATPNIDRLTKRGMIFRNTYCSNPICCPSRASMWAGLHTWNCEAWNNHKGLEPGVPTALSHLRDGGYTLAGKEGGLGKMDYLSGSHSLMNRLGAWTAPAGIELPGAGMEPPKVLPDDGLRLGTRASSLDWDAIDQGKAFLEAHRRDRQPFFLYVGVNMPHPAFITNRHYLAMVDRDAVTIPPEDKELHPVMRYQQTIKNWTHGFAPEMVRQTRAIYYAMCAEADAMVGALLDEMDRLGLSDNTFFIFTSDHGENAMEHHQWYKMNMYESSARVPLVISGPGVRRGGSVTSTVSLVDLYPTLMDMAKLPIPAGLDGQSLLSLLTGRTTQSRNWAVSMFSDASANTTIFMLRRGEWKYIAYPGYEPQLFNLRRDPEEIENFARTEPDAARQMDEALRQVVDYQAINRRVIAYDKASFRAWREQALAGPVPNFDAQNQPIRKSDGTIELLTYEQAMGRFYQGWGPEHEQKIKRWLGDK